MSQPSDDELAEHDQWIARAAAEDEGGPEHLSALAAKAEALACGSQDEAAMRIWERVLEGRRQILGLEHPETLEAWLWFVRTLGWSGDVDRAVEEGEWLLQATMRAYSEDDPHTLEAMQTLAQVLRIDATVPASQRALELLQRLAMLQTAWHGPDSEEVLRTRSAALDAMIGLDRIDEVLAGIDELENEAVEALSGDSTLLLDIGLIRLTAYARRVPWQPELAPRAIDAAEALWDRCIIQIGQSEDRSRIAPQLDALSAATDRIASWSDDETRLEQCLALLASLTDGPYPELLDVTAEWHGRLAALLWDRGRHDDAIEAARRAWLWTEDPVAALRLSAMLIDAGRPEEGERIARSALDGLGEEPIASAIHRNVAAALRERGELKQALAEFRTAQTMAGDDEFNLVAASRGVADCLYRLGRHREAASAYKELIPGIEKHYPREWAMLVVAHERHAWALHATGSSAAAVKALRRGIRLAEEHGDSALALRMRIPLADYLLGAGRADEAIREAAAVSAQADEALEASDPARADAHLAHVTALAVTGRHRAAARASRRLVRPFRQAYGRRSPQVRAAKKGRRRARGGRIRRAAASTSFRVVASVIFAVLVTSLVRGFWD